MPTNPPNLLHEKKSPPSPGRQSPVRHTSAQSSGTDLIPSEIGNWVQGESPRQSNPKSTVKEWVSNSRRMLANRLCHAALLGERNRSSHLVLCRYVCFFLNTGTINPVSSIIQVKHGAAFSSNDSNPTRRSPKSATRVLADGPISRGVRVRNDFFRRDGVR